MTKTKLTTITGEWGAWEWDGKTRIRFLGLHSEPATGRYAKKLAQYIGKGGTLPCIEMAEKDADGFVQIVPGSLQVEVGKPIKFVIADAGHPAPNFHGTIVQSIT